MNSPDHPSHLVYITLDDARYAPQLAAIANQRDDVAEFSVAREGPGSDQGEVELMFGVRGESDVDALARGVALYQAIREQARLPPHDDPRAGTQAWVG